MARSESLRSIPAGKATTAAFIISICYIAWIFFVSKNPQTYRWVSAIGQNLSLVLFLYFGIKMVREYQIKPELRRSWVLLIVATGALVIAEVIHILQGRPEHSIAELFYVAYYSLYISGILLLPFIPISRNEKSLLLLDLAIVMCASLLLLSYFLVDSVYSLIAAENYRALARTIYPVLDLLILACTVTMIQRDVDGVHPAALVLIAIANGYISIADALWALGAFQTSTVEANTIGAIYTSGRAFLLLGLAYQIQFLSFQENTSKYSLFKHALRTWLPYLAGTIVFVFLAVGVLAKQETLRSNLRGVVLGTPILALLIFYRQYLILQENMLLYKEAKDARERAENATAAKGEFLAIMSHEIRTPMHGVIGMSEMLIDSGLNENQLEMADTLRRSGKHLLGVINEVLDFSKIEARKLELEAKPFDLYRCIRASLDSFKPESEKKGIKLVCTIDPAVPALVVADEVRIQEIIMNLLSNAVKFTAAGEIELKCTSSIIEKQKAELWISVIDSGAGIPMDLQNKLFRPFSQVDRMKSRRRAGTGLGLAISKELCEMMGGKIWVESKDGTGAKFSFIIIVDILESSATIETPKEIDRSLGDRHPMRVLIVEDNPVSQKVTSLMMRQLGYYADLSSNGMEAIELTKTRGYDLILMDIQMPGMDGFECTKKIREAGDSSLNPIIIAMTAGSRNEDEEKCLAAGMNDTLMKPATIKDIENKIKQWCRDSKQ